MRNTLLALVIALSACATTGTRPVNVAAVRTEINETIQASAADRSVTAMGKTTPERATVFTTSKTGTRQEENWVKANGSWKMENSSALNTN